MELKAVKENEQQNDMTWLADNLSALLRSRNMNINQLANALNLPTMTIRRLLSSETTDPRLSTLKMIADFFGVSIDFLVDRNNQQSIKPLKKSKPHFVPILDWSTAEKIENINNLDINNWKDWQSISLQENETLSERAFALKSRPSMYPRFPQGTVFIIDPEVPPTDGDIILVKTKKNNELTIKELTIDPPEWRLKSVISGSNIIKYSKQEHIIVGVTVLTILYKRGT